jgi:hypothetical protein
LITLLLLVVDLVVGKQLLLVAAVAVAVLAGF